MRPFFHSPMTYRAVVCIHGMENQHCYGPNPATVLARAIRHLTEHEPGFANTTPLRVELYQREHAGFAWQFLKTVNYQELSEGQHEWRKPRQKQTRR